MNRIIIIISITICTIILVIVWSNNSEKSFTDITEKTVREVAYVTFVHYKISEEIEEKVDKDILKDYSDCRYVKYTGSLGNTHQFIWRFYNYSHKLLFELRDIGNRGIIGITIGKKTRYYRTLSKSLK